MSSATVLLLTALTAAAAGLTEDRARLYHDLRSTYYRAIPPIGDTPLNVSVGLSLIYVTPLSDSKVDVDAWIILEWTDPRLSWDKEEYHADSIRVPQDFIWTPDIVPYNNLDVRQPSQEKFLAMVSNSGDMTVVNKATLRLPCIEVSGERQCQVKFGSWVYDGLHINLLSKSSDVDMSDFIADNHHTVSDTSVRRDVTHYACCPEPYPSVTFTFKLTENRGWFS